MANLPETSTWESGIYQLETTDAALGGAGAVMNAQATKLGNRTKWLYDTLAALSTVVSNLSTAFTNLRYSYKYSVGTPSTPATTGFTTTLNQNVNYVYINAEVSGADSYITLQVASATNVGRRIVFNVKYNGQGPLVIRKSDNTILITDTSYYSRVIIIEYIQTGSSTYDVEVIMDHELQAATTAEIQAGNGLRKYVTPAGLHTHAAWITLTVDADFTGNLYCRKDNEGIVHLRGQVTGSSIEGGIGGLASGYRPAIQQTFRVIATDGDDASVIVYTNGAILTSLTGSSRTITLDGIYFFTD